MRSNVAPQTSRWCFQSEYRPPLKRTQINNKLATHRMSALVSAGHSMEKALSATYQLIPMFAPQVPASHRGDSHKVDFLRGAVVNYDWATEPLSRVATQGPSFQQLYG